MRYTLIKLLYTHSLRCFPPRTFASHIVLTKTYSTPPHVSKLEVMRKHNVSRLRQHNLKAEINEKQKTPPMKKIIKNNLIEDCSIVEAESSFYVPCSVDNIILQNSKSTDITVSNMTKNSDDICDDKDDITFTDNSNSHVVVDPDRNTDDQNIDDSGADEQSKIIQNDINDDNNDDNSYNNSINDINRKNSNCTVGNTDPEDSSDCINNNIIISDKNSNESILFDNIRNPISTIEMINSAGGSINHSTSPSTNKKKGFMQETQISDNINPILKFSKNLENCIENHANSNNFDVHEISCEKLSFDKLDIINSTVNIKEIIQNDFVKEKKINVIRNHFGSDQYTGEKFILKKQKIDFEKEFQNNDIDENYNFKINEINQQQKKILMELKKEYELEYEKDESQRMLRHKLLREEVDLDLLRYVSAFHLFVGNSLVLDDQDYSLSLCLPHCVFLSFSFFSSHFLSLPLFLSLSFSLSLPLFLSLSLSPSLSLTPSYTFCLIQT